jgi:hypothetical protein
MLGHDWQPAEGTCVDDNFGGEHVIRERWVMDVRPANGAPPFRVEVDHPGAGEDFRGPDVGQVCRMLCDVKKQKAKFDHTDPTLSWKAHRRAEQQRLRAELNAAPGTAGVFPGIAGFPGLGGGNVQVLSGADAAPLLDAIFSGHAQEGIAALRAMKQAQQHQQPGVVPQAPFSAPPAPSAQAPFAAQPPYADQAPFSAQAPFGAPAPFAAQEPAAAPAGDLAERLARLQALHDQGLVSLSEYTTQRQRIIESL